MNIRGSELAAKIRRNVLIGDKGKMCWSEIRKARKEGHRIRWEGKGREGIGEITLLRVWGRNRDRGEDGLGSDDQRKTLWKYV